MCNRPGPGAQNLDRIIRRSAWSSVGRLITVAQTKRLGSISRHVCLLVADFSGFRSVFICTIFAK